jgi:hypothetical protein
MTHDDFTYKTLLKESFELTKKHFLFLLAVLAINVTIEILLSKTPSELSPVGGILSLAVSMATTYVILVIVNGKKPLWSDLVQPFKNYLIPLHYLLAVIALGVLFFAGVLIPLAALGINKVVFAVAMIAYVLAAIYFGVRFSFFRYFILENEKLGPIEALKKSWNMTDGRFWKLAGYSAVLILLNMLGLLAFGLGLILTLPMSAIAVTLIYKKWTHSHSPVEGRHLA